MVPKGATLVGGAVVVGGGAVVVPVGLGGVVVVTGGVVVAGVAGVALAQLPTSIPLMTTTASMIRRKVLFILSSPYIYLREKYFLRIPGYVPWLFLPAILPFFR
jgi:hypothetical protein